MKRLILSMILALSVLAVTSLSLSGDRRPLTKGAEGPLSDTALNKERVYPIAPGVWYPGQGPLPEKPIRYYRVRCWPGCHRGSDYGKYPDRPLPMDPIHQTSALRGHKGVYRPTDKSDRK